MVLQILEEHNYGKCLIKRPPPRPPSTSYTPVSNHTSSSSQTPLSSIDTPGCSGYTPSSDRSSIETHATCEKTTDDVRNNNTVSPEKLAPISSSKCIDTPISSKDLSTSGDIDKKPITIDLTDDEPVEKSLCNEKNTSPPNAQKLLSKAEQILAQCKQGLNDLQIVPSEPPETLKVKEEPKSVEVSKNEKNESKEEDLFGDDDEDFFENEMMKIDEKSLIVTTPKKNSFFDNICPDLLKASQSASTSSKKKATASTPRVDFTTNSPRLGKRQLSDSSCVKNDQKRANLNGSRETPTNKNESHSKNENWPTERRDFGNNSDTPRPKRRRSKRISK